MRLYSNANDMYSHRVSIALNIKDITAELVIVNPDNLKEEFLEVNQYASSPTLVDRELVIYNSDIILNYLDERFPHPPLLPIEPIERTKLRGMIYRVEQDWVRLANLIGNSDNKTRVAKAKELLTNQLIAMSPRFSENKFFGSAYISLLDCTIIPLLSRLDQLGINISAEQAPDLTAYMQRVFDLDVVKSVDEQLAPSQSIEQELG